MTERALRPSHNLNYESVAPAGAARLDWQRKADSVEVRVTYEPERRVAKAMRAWQLVVAYTAVSMLAFLVLALFPPECGVLTFGFILFFGVLHWFRRGFTSRESFGERTTFIATAHGVRLLNEDLLPDGTTRFDLPSNSAYGGQQFGDASHHVLHHQIRGIECEAFGDGYHLATLIDEHPLGIYLPTDASEAKEIEAAVRGVLGLPPKT